MGQFVIACYRPLEGKAKQLQAIVKEHLPTLRREDLVTDRPAHVMQSADGTILEVFEWKSQAAIDAAHENKNVMALWDRFGQVCEYVPLAGLAEANQVFPPFAPVEL